MSNDTEQKPKVSHLRAVRLEDTERKSQQELQEGQEVWAVEEYASPSGNTNENMKNYTFAFNVTSMAEAVKVGKREHQKSLQDWPTTNPNDDRRLIATFVFATDSFDDVMAMKNAITVNGRLTPEQRARTYKISSEPTPLSAVE